jgi:hypothetical protein
MTQPGSGIPQPVPGVTGGQGLPQGVASVEGSTGNVVITPPSNVLQVRKGVFPQSFQVYEYFNNNTDFSRIALNAQTGGPFQIAVETDPPSVIRGLDINAGGSLFINTDNVFVNTSVQIMGNLVVAGTGIIESVEVATSFVFLQGATPAPAAGVMALGNSTLPTIPGVAMLDWIVNFGGTAYRVHLYQ